MPMVNPITDYDARRKTKRSRGFSLPDEPMVYFAMVGSSGLVKIGVTKNISRRAQGHRQETGQTCRYVAQLLVHSMDDARRLEAHAISSARASLFQGTRREWFSIGEDDLTRFIAKVVATSPVDITIQRGAPEAPEHALPSWVPYAHETLSAAKASSSRKSGRPLRY